MADKEYEFEIKHEMSNEKKEFIKELDADLEVLVNDGTLPQISGKTNIREKANTFYMAYYAKKMADYTKILAILTTALVLTAALNIANVWYGVELTKMTFIDIVLGLAGSAIVIILFVAFIFIGQAIVIGIDKRFNLKQKIIKSLKGSQKKKKKV